MARRYVAQAERWATGDRSDQSEQLLQRAIDDQKRGGGGSEESWHVVGDPGEPGYQNTWTFGGTLNVDPPLRFKKIDNVVYIQGYVSNQGSTLPNVIFTLPVGYRPAYDQAFVVGPIATPQTVVRVAQNGDVWADNSTNNAGRWFSIALLLT